MEPGFPHSWQNLTVPWVRQALLLSLDELVVDDPRPLWAVERQRGLASGIDEVIHFFFDDNDFDENAVGYCLLPSEEALKIGRLKDRLIVLLCELPDGSDDAFVEHPFWPTVTKAAVEALAHLRRQ